MKTIFAILLLSAFSIAQKVEPVGKPELPVSIAAATQEHGVRIIDKDGVPLLSAWLAKSIATSQKDVEGANYPQFDTSSFIGAVTFEQDGKDFRGQAIPKGTYTLRYALLPNDGNHMGVSPNRDFLLLLPLISDPEPSVRFGEKQLYRASSKVAGGAHPTVMSLVGDEGKAETVTISAEGYLVLHLVFTTPNGPLPIAIVVKGQAQQ